MNVINVNCMMLWFLQINTRLHAKKSALRIVGGEDGDPETHQYIVRMEMKVTGPRDDLVTTHHLCTGTAITPIWVLTAAHCIEGKEMYTLSSSKKFNRNLVIRYGSVTPETNGTLSDILAVQKHPLYTLIGKLPVSFLRNDIGLIKTTPIHLDKYGKLSAVDYKALFGHAAVAAGYGGRGIPLKYEKPADLLLRDTLQVMDVLMNKCTELKQMFPAICLSRRCGRNASICPGDSGGPLMHPSGVVGVNSISVFADCFPNMLIPIRSWSAFVTPVSPYIDWIKNHMKQNGMT